MSSRTVTLSQDQLAQAVLLYVNKNRSVFFPDVKGPADVSILFSVEWSKIYTDVTIGAEDGK